MTQTLNITTKIISVTVNNESHSLNVNSNETLLDILRNKLQIKSIKAACWQGDCGICTILLEGKPVKSCLVLAWEAHERSILTVEGLMDGKNLSKLQEAFIRNGAIQCGFCTSAFLLMGHYLLSKGEPLSRESIKGSLNGILCRCTGYSDLIESIYEVYLDIYK